ncbi:hypothetical protein [Staphylococcus ratti]|uniref:Uncharacterized protein n=1 Tax=Staphylococcus ratti TaxID=2892440 RepID=A0ABY3PDK5_9STAP|nr:hypothetical protein [Staphylococcus ratti]UEX90335.1 hypothetical protein LN051_01300 [Staphylococcus ratti]
MAALLVLIVYLTKCNALVANFDMSKLPKQYVQKGWNLWILSAMSVIISALLAIILYEITTSGFAFTVPIIGIAIAIWAFIRIHKYIKKA